MYNRSGEQSASRGTWGSPEEQERWKRNSLKQTTYPSAILYSIAVLEEGDFNEMGREMPKGTGIDNSILGDDNATIVGSLAATPKHRRGPYKKKAKKDSDGVAKAIAVANKDEKQLRALQLLLRYGTAADKAKALASIRAMSEQEEEAEAPTNGNGEEDGNRDSDRSYQESDGDETDDDAEMNF